MSKYFYCYSVKMKNFLKENGLEFINKSINLKTNKPYFLFEKSKKLDELILMWNNIKK